jgi:dihydropteroate synthase
MHMQGEPRTMQEAPHYRDVVAEVGAFLGDRVKAAVAARIGHEPSSDPGFGFGRTPQHNLELIRALPRLRMGYPLLAGLSLSSVKSSVVRQRNAYMPAWQRIACRQRDPSIVRVHDMAATDSLLLFASHRRRHIYLQ